MTLFGIILKCFSKLSLLPMINSSNSTSTDSFITFESINKLYSGRLVLLTITNWNFSEFAFRVYSEPS